ncbi:DUF1553 domain-containing protein [Arundinibacter roseus]|uniref:DUF1553 domain-containing protein n=1 Tax=Arundinibacter roseus TaxID=2070510 RepID=A0A4V2XAF7_9BACT|nr:DUF1553 domain-containing protein [Arundinibacter roseus]TDB67545.1 DUF1553 domain-containing protein [Arundinibacter roseus]
MNFSLLIWLGGLLGMAVLPPPELPRDVADEYKKLTYALDYNQHVKPILSDKCFACHGPDKAKQEAGLRLDLPITAYSPLPESPGKVAISLGNLKKSEVFYRILSKDPTYVMPTPKSHMSLSAKEKAILIKWIEQGAVYQVHWAFVKPVKKAPPSLPATSSSELLPIDAFIQSRLALEGLQSSPLADKELLLRRVSLDLTGLPPTTSEIDSFLADSAANAYEKQVDRLLNSPHFGEKKATDWLDLARFADSHGYTVDRLRDMSPYRDWVIEAFNQNMPYDTFIHQQLAGDLMPSPSRKMLIATAFNRNHPQNMEGGIVEQEFQTEYVMDRTNTFGDAFLAMSVGCARCHDHKYDPISQKNYYQLFSFFNNVREAGQIAWNDDLPTPTLLLPTEAQEKVLDFIKQKITTQQQTVQQLIIDSDSSFENWLQSNDWKKLATQQISMANLLGYYDFEDSLNNSLNPVQAGIMKRDAGTIGDKPMLQKSEGGQVLLLDGDVYLDLKDVGVYRKSDAFSIGAWVQIPKEFREGVIFHKSNAERLYNFKGYHLLMKDNRLEVTLAHTAPSNAITRLTTQEIPRDTWIQLTMTYDGSSKAAGLKLYLNGTEMQLETVVDQLYKDIIFFSKNEPALQIGGWWRGLGFKGGKIDNIAIYSRAITPFEIQILSQKASWKSLAELSVVALNASQKEILRQYYQSVVSPQLLAARAELQHLQAQLADSSENIREIMVMQEMPTPRKTFLLNRGQYDDPGEPVLPNTPESILDFPENLPKNRYGLAQWLTHGDNPLTARVAVNHAWQSFFGVGLVKTAEDFGNQGEMPSHAELLDWLAVDFRESGWDIKRLNKQIVMSATYRQDSRTTAEMRERDPENRLLSRGPTTRLTAEMIRDNALVASGLFKNTIGGKSIKPYQPAGLWEINSSRYEQDSTDEIYRRSLYILVKRSVPNPTLGTFDAPSRSGCTVRRQATNTPLQALVTLNDPTFIEAARVLGQRMMKQENPQQAVALAYRALTGRKPTEGEIDLLVDLYQKEQARYLKNPEKAIGWLKTGLAKSTDDTPEALATLAANAVVASTIMNLDATITKR